jgi:hypothetical protein
VPQAFQAFLAAWREACNSSDDPSTFLVPEGNTYLLMPVTFRGPCRAISVTAIVSLISTVLTIPLHKSFNIICVVNCDAHYNCK